MKPREFLSEGDYPLTVALTYSFDPVFFERLALPSLWAGGADDILVLADGGEVDRAFHRVNGAIHHLGRRYLLAPVRRTGAFHPKLVLRLGREGGAVWLSTGNLTHGGWGLNREAGAAWRIGPGLDDLGEWVRPLLADAREWADSQLADRMLDRMSDLPWLFTESTQGPRLLLSGARALGPQLALRWGGRRFDRLRFLTGSTDRDGQVLRWLNGAFGVTRAVGAITPSRCAWTAAGLEDLPLDLALAVHHSPVLHAKAYHLSGPDGDVLLLGSANCSRSAWLRPPLEGGNVEAMLVYEDPSPADLAFLDEALGEDPKSAVAVLADIPLHGEDPPSLPPVDLHLRAFQIEEGGGVVVRVDGVPADRSLVLVLEGEEIPLRKEGAHWVGRPPDTFAPGQTAFGHVEGRRKGLPSLVSARRWADDLRLLHQSGGVRRLGRALSDLTRPATQKEDDRLLQELRQLAHDLIHDSRALADPFMNRPKGTGIGSGNGAPVVNPDSLVHSLKDVVVPSTHPVSGREGSQSLAGIFPSLFGHEDAESEGAEVGVEDPPDPDDGSEDEPRATDPPDAALPAPVAPRTRERFAAHMDRFVAGLQTPSFRAHCTATQLVQAAGYPFAATALGVRRGWTDEDAAREWLTVTAATLLRPGPAKEPPLLEEVQGRYETDGSSEVFGRIVGEGTLWVVMTVGLAGLTWPGPAGALQRMIFLRDLWTADVLRARADTERLDALIRRYRAVDAVALVRDVAGPMAAAAVALQDRLQYLCNHEDLLRRQAEHRRPIQEGELVWGPVNDWALPLEPELKRTLTVFWPQQSKEARIRVDQHFVSVPQVAEQDPVVRAALDRLLDLWARLTLSSLPSDEALELG